MPIIEGLGTPLGQKLKKDTKARDEVRERRAGETQKHSSMARARSEVLGLARQEKEGKKTQKHTVQRRTQGGKNLV